MTAEIEGQLPEHVMETLRAAAKATSRVERLKRYGILYIACAVTAMLAVVSISAYHGWGSVDTAGDTLDAVRQTQLEQTRRGQDIKTSATSSEAILMTLTDCLTPGGKCYQRNVANQANVLATVQRLVVVTQLCAKDKPSSVSYQAMQDCVTGLMKEHTDGG